VKSGTKTEDINKTIPPKRKATPIPRAVGLLKKNAITIEPKDAIRRNIHTPAKPRAVNHSGKPWKDGSNCADAIIGNKEKNRNKKTIFSFSIIKYWLSKILILSLKNKTNFNKYLNTLAYHNLSVFLKNLESGKILAPALEHDWISSFLIFLMVDVDGVWTYKSSLPEIFFEQLYRKEKYSQHSKKIDEAEKRMIASGDSRYFELIAKELKEAPLTWNDYIEACEISAKEVRITPHAHDALVDLYTIQPFVGLGFNSASWIDSLNFFAQYKKLPVSLIEGSWLEFKNNKFTGRYFFNYGKNKWKTGNRMLSNLKCVPDLKISRSSGIKTITLSDSLTSDIYFRNFAGLGGMTVWMDKNIQERLFSPQKEIIELNIPEIIEDMRIFSSAIKHMYRTRIISVKNSPEELRFTITHIKKLIEFGRECLNLTEENLFEKKIQEFFYLSQKVLNMLQKFDFPRYSTGIDFKYLKLLSRRMNMKERKEIISEILETYVQNFPETLLEENLLDEFVKF
jgi:hypothetical protein